MHAATTTSSPASSHSFGRRVAAAMAAMAVGLTLFAGAWATSNDTGDNAFHLKKQGRKIALDGRTDRRWVR
jgi:hypothetical protein